MRESEQNYALFSLLLSVYLMFRLKKKTTLMVFTLLEKWTPNLPDSNIASSWLRLEMMLKIDFF